MLRTASTARERIAQEIRYTQLVFSFIAGKSPPWNPPDPSNYGVSHERASEIIGWALICDLSDLAMGRAYGYNLPEDSGVFTSARHMHFQV
jgi:hypothetical protein